MTVARRDRGVDVWCVAQRLSLVVFGTVVLSCRQTEKTSVARAESAPAGATTDSGAPAPKSTAAVTLSLEEVARGLDAPVHLSAPAGDPRLFIVEQEGRIRIVDNGRLLERPFLDITGKVGCCGERGLLSIAFHPQYRTNGFFYLNYTDNRGDTRIERYTVSADRNVADAGSAKLILGIDQPYANHNGGLSLFGPDGMLYIGMGDGGSGGDPQGNGQDPNTLLGKMLRIDIDRGDPYAVPPDNPFVRNRAGRAEIWATGLRNPWRFTFDRVAGLLYIGDVGQNAQEEINVVPATRAAVNYGWNVMEGTACFRGRSCNKSAFEPPALTYQHGDGVCSVIGGPVYRGSRIPEIEGHHFYSDYCRSWLRSFRYADGRVTDRRDWPIDRAGSIVSFGEDSAGEIYVCSSNGRVYRIVARPAASG